MKEMIRKAYFQLWRESCEAQHKAEGKRGIKLEMNRDREVAKAYRDDQKTFRKEEAEYDPDEDMEIEDTDEQNRDAAKLG
jgi:hypothetical protein